MAHNADGMQILTHEDARRYIRENDCKEMREDIMRALNVSGVEIDDDGDVHVGAPQPHWLSGDELIRAIEMIESGV